jgi:hypothetical protein
MSCEQATAEALHLDTQQRLIAVAVLDITAGQITSISATVNSDKLAHLGPVGDLTSLPGGQVLSVDLRFRDSRLAIGDEFPDLGIVSPLTLGGTEYPIGTGSARIPG